MSPWRGWTLVLCCLLLAACGDKDADAPTPTQDMGGQDASGDLTDNPDLEQDPDVADMAPEDLGQGDAEPPPEDMPEDAREDLPQPDLGGPDLADMDTPDQGEPDLVEPDLVELDMPESDLGDADMEDPDLADPDLGEPDVVDPDLGEPDLGEPDVVEPDPCDSFAVVTPRLSLLPLFSASLEAEGGVGPQLWRYAPEGNQSGGILDEASGFYLSGEVGGVVDLVEVLDEGCGLTGSVEIQVVAPLEVLPSRPEVMQGQTLCFGLEGGSGDLAWTLVQAASGAPPQNLVDGCYQAGDVAAGEDVVRVTDRATGQSVEVRIQVRDRPLSLVPSVPLLMLPPGQRASMQVQGGSGEYELEVQGAPLLMEPPQQGQWIIQGGQQPGHSTLVVRDRFLEGLETQIQVAVLAPSRHQAEKFGTHGDEQAMLKPGDLDGDGVADVAVALRGSSLNGMHTGAVFLYRGLPEGGLEPQPMQILTGRGRYDFFGQSMAAGDFNQDGCPDLAVGVRGRDTAGGDAGAVEIWLGCGAAQALEGPPGPASSRQDNGVGPDEQSPMGLWRTLYGEAGGDLYGWSVASGDFDGDQRDDLVVSAPRYDALEQSNSGRLYLYTHAEEGGLNTEERWMVINGRVLSAEGQLSAARDLEYGWQLKTGRVDEDACDDILVGSSNHNSQHGYVTLHLTREDPDAPGRCRVRGQPSLAIEPHEDDLQRAGRLGWRLALGDLDGDCVQDLVVTQLTSRAIGGANTSAGAVNVFLGRDWEAGGPLLLDRRAADLIIEGDSWDQMGSAVDVGDFNGDGADDLIVGGRYAESPGVGTDTGELRFYWGMHSAQGCAGRMDPEAPLVNPEYSLLPGRPGRVGDSLGQGASLVGDLNGDGRPDLMILEDRGPSADPADDSDHFGRLGWLPSSEPPYDLEQVQTLEMPSVYADELFGWSVANVGDVNEDGYHDFLVGAPFADYREVREQDSVTRVSAGMGYLFLGGPGGLRATPDRRLGGYNHHTDSDNLGYSVGSGDIDGDGVPDMILGSNGEDATGNYCQPCRNNNVNRSDIGAVYIYRGGAALGERFDGEPGQEPLLDSPDYVICGPQVNNLRVGRRVLSGFDFDNDGRDDVLMSNVTLTSSRGRVWAVSSASLSQDNPVICMDNGHELGQGDNNSDALGQSLIAMDINGDGCDDMLAGAYNDDPPGRTNSGSVTAWMGYGGPGCLESPVTLLLSGAANNDNMGYGLAVGDFNGDGTQDLAVGSVGLGNGNLGAVLIYSGQAMREQLAGVTADHSAVLDNSLLIAELFDPSGVNNNNYASYLSNVGDMDGDGDDELLVGAWLTALSPDHAGRTGAAWLFRGDADLAQLGRADGLAVGVGDFDDGRLGAEVAGGPAGEEGWLLLMGAPYTELPGAERGEQGLLFSTVLP